MLCNVSYGIQFYERPVEIWYGGRSACCFWTLLESLSRTNQLRPLPYVVG